MFGDLDNGRSSGAGFGGGSDNNGDDGDDLEAPRLLLVDYPNHVFYERELTSGVGKKGDEKLELEAEMASFVAAAMAGELTPKPLAV